MDGFQVPNTFPCPNELVDQYLNRLNGSQTKILLYIIRKTFGWHTQWAILSDSQICKDCGLSEKATDDNLGVLLELKLVIRYYVCVDCKTPYESYASPCACGSTNIRKIYGLNVQGENMMDYLKIVLKIEDKFNKDESKPSAPTIIPESSALDDSKINPLIKELLSPLKVNIAVLNTLPMTKQVGILQYAIQKRYSLPSPPSYTPCKNLINDYKERDGIYYILDRLLIMPLELDNKSRALNILSLWCKNPAWGNGDKGHNGNNGNKAQYSQKEKDFAHGKLQMTLYDNLSDRNQKRLILNGLLPYYARYGDGFGTHIGLTLDGCEKLIKEYQK